MYEWQGRVQATLLTEDEWPSSAPAWMLKVTGLDARARSVEFYCHVVIGTGPGPALTMRLTCSPPSLPVWQTTRRSLIRALAAKLAEHGAFSILITYEPQSKLPHEGALNFALDAQERFRMKTWAAKLG